MDTFTQINPLNSLRNALQKDLATIENPSHSCRPVALFLPEGSTSLGRFYGSVGLADMSAFQAALGDLVTESVLKIVLDLAEISLTRSAVGGLVAFAADIHGRNKRLYLYRTPQKLRAVLSELDIRSFFGFLETEEDIISTLAV